MDDSTTHNTVFVDTGLDTHLALVISDTDTVSDLKHKIMYEHPLCFPNFGNIKILAVKVKRKGCFYHLTDSMLVKTAFAGVTKSWFLSIDASSNALLCVTNDPVADVTDRPSNGTMKKLYVSGDSELHEVEKNQPLNQKASMADPFGPSTSTRNILKDLEMEVEPLSGDQCKTSSSNSSQKMDLETLGNSDQFSQGNKMGRLDNYKNYNTLKEISDSQFKNPSKDNNIQNGVDSKKKGRAKRKFEALENSSTPKVNNDHLHESGIQAEHNDDRLNDTRRNVSSIFSTKKKRKIQRKNKDPLNEKDALMDGKQEIKTVMHETSKPVILAASKEITIAGEQGTITASEETSKPVNINLANKMDDKQENTTALYDNLSTATKDDSLVFDYSIIEKKEKKKRKMEPSDSCNDGAAADTSSMEDIREEKQKVTSHKNSVEKATMNGELVQDAMQSELFLISQDMVAVHDVLSHEIDTSEVVAEQIRNKRESSQNNDSQIMLPEKTNPVNEGDTEMSMKEVAISSKLLDENGVVEPMKSAGRVKKLKKTKKTDGGKQVTSTIEQANSSGVTSREPHNSEYPSHSHKKSKKAKDVPSQTTTEVADKETVNAVQMKVQDVDHSTLPIDKIKETGSSDNETINTSNLGAYEKVQEVHQNLNESIQPTQDAEVEESPVNQVMKEKKKSSLSVQFLSDVKMKEQVDVGHSTPLIDKPEETDAYNRTVNTSNLDALEKIHEVHENVEESVQPMQAGEVEESLVNLAVKGKKKSRRKSSLSIENLRVVPMKEQDVGYSTPTIDKTKGTCVSDDKTKETYVSDDKTVDTSNLGAQGKVHEVHENVDESVQLSKAENIEDPGIQVVKKMKKSKKKSSLCVENPSDMQIKELDVVRSSLTVYKTMETEATDNEIVNASNSGAHAKAHEMHEKINLSELMPAGEVEENPVNGVMKRKSKKKSSLSEENFSDMHIKEQVVVHSTPSIDKIKEMDASDNETVNTSNLEAHGKVHKMRETVGEPGKQMHAREVEKVPANRVVKEKKKSKKKSSAQMKGVDDLHSTPSIDKSKEVVVSSLKKTKSNLVGTPKTLINASTLQSEKGPVNQSEQCQTVVDADPKSSLADEIIKRVPGFSQQPHEITGSLEAFDDNVNDMERSEGNMETEMNSVKLNQQSVGTSRFLHDPHMSNDNHNSETESKVGNSSTIKGSIRNVKSGELMPGPKKNPSNLPRNKPSTSTALTSSPVISFHNDKSQMKNKPLTATKASADYSGKNKSHCLKSLLAITGNIFKDGDYESSEDDGLVDSDASTRTPSDNSSSSDDSDAENKTGSQSGKRNSKVGNSSGPNIMSLDAIMKSSSRFKKAKIIASQSQYVDTEGQPLEFVPDSQPNV